MALPPGTRLGPYEVISAIGAGGMGEVYRGRDSRLNREVALKILPDAVAHDPDRLARFKREAHVLASLNHPNIAAIYGFEESNAVQALVLELVEGPTLADRIAQGAIPVEEALPIARQIAEALEAAHEQGIIHRDLKPANIKLRPDGLVKVLDFGLAKALEPAAVNQDAAIAPTITSPAMTGMGVILGTAAYMSPEQTKARGADKRSDLWAFGCVLYEMLTGRRVFEGEDVTDTLAFVITKQPEWNALPTTTPTTIRKLLRRCLEKDRKRRLADAADVRLEIDEALATPAIEVAGDPRANSERSRFWRPVVIAPGALVLGGLLVGGAIWAFKPTAASPTIIRFALTLPSDQQFTEYGSAPLAISPDGTAIAYVANRQLYLRSISELQAKPIPGAAMPQGRFDSLVFSPDGRSIAFTGDVPANIKRIQITGGPAVTVCEGCAALGNMSWTAEGIVFVQAGRGLPVTVAGERSRQGGFRIMRVSEDGGEPELLFNITDGTPWDAQMLPGGEDVLFTLIPGVTGNGVASGITQALVDKAQIIVQSVKSGERKVVIDGGTAARYLPAGHIVYARGGVLFARRFDPETRSIVGQAVPIVDGVRRYSSSVGSLSPAAYFDISQTGVLAYIPGPSSTSRQGDLAVLDQQKGVVPLKLPPDLYELPRVSPDGKSVAVATNDGREVNIWIYDLAGTSSLRRLTFGGKNRFPVWSSDGRYITFQSDREGEPAIFWQPADGSGAAERLTKPDRATAHVPSSWSADGGHLLFDIVTGSGRALWAFSARDRKSTPVVADIQNQNVSPFDATFSPNGRWIAYGANANGVSGVYVEPFPTTGSRYLIASRTINPSWSRDGQSLYFRRMTTSEFMFTRVTTESGFTFSTPQPLQITFKERQGNTSPRNHDITPDGKIIVAIASSQASNDASTGSEIDVVVNWFEELKRLVPVK